MDLLELKKQYKKSKNKVEFVKDLIGFLDSKNKDSIFGGILAVKHIKGLISQSYKKKADDNFDGWILDKQLTKGRSKVYYNPSTGQSVVSHAGTDSGSDWGNNLIYGLFGKKGYKYTSRYKDAEKVQKEALKKYGAEKLSTLGHSQSGMTGEILNQKGLAGRELITLNKASRIGSNVKASNQYDIRSSGDVVSALNPLQGKSSNDVIIPKGGYNPLTEHSPDILDRLDPEMMIGQGRKRRGGKGKIINYK
jgi:hypothetical protein